MKEHYEHILDRIPLSIITCNKELRINSANKTCSDMFNLNDENIIGRHLSEIIPLDVITDEKLDAKIFKVLETKEPSEEMGIEYNFPGIGNKILNLKILGITHAEREEEVILLIDDITEKTKIQEKLILTDKVASIELMATGFAHEVNNPIAIIKGNAQYMLDKIHKTSADKPRMENEEECIKTFERIAEEATRCSTIISGILKFTKESEENLYPLDINLEIMSTISIAEHNLALHHIKVIHELSSYIPKIMGNANNLRQVFINIILNAQAAMPESGVLTVRSFYDKDNGLAGVEFEDTGQGISHENLKKIFDPFFSTKKPGQGIGLGLSISKGIITTHKGTIYVKSNVGKGTVVSIEIPIAKS